MKVHIAVIFEQNRRRSCLILLDRWPSQKLPLKRKIFMVIYSWELDYYLCWLAQKYLSRTIERSDAGKFLLILNQLDATAKEDNAEQVVAAWQRAIVQTGLSTGRFYCIFNDKAAVKIEDEGLKRRYEEKRDIDLKEIEHRMSEVSVERVYRIIGALENMANRIESHAIPAIKDAKQKWYKQTLIMDAVIYSLIAMGGIFYSIQANYWQGGSCNPSWLASFQENPTNQMIALVISAIVVIGVHFWSRSVIAKRVAKRIKPVTGVGSIVGAFMKNTGFFHSVFNKNPVGWGRYSKKTIAMARHDADSMVKTLNDKYSDPLGRQEALNIREEEMPES